MICRSIVFRGVLEQAGVQTCFILQNSVYWNYTPAVNPVTLFRREDTWTCSGQRMKWLKLLIRLEDAGIPLDDFTNALAELSMLDRFTGINIADEALASGATIFGLHGIDHTVRVTFWVLYLVEISNRMGFPIREEDALAAMYAAMIHDLSRKDDFPGGQHGRDAARDFRSTLQTRLNREQLERCLAAVEWHGFAKEPDFREPVWMLLKDADALDRARLGPPRTRDGCDPARLRLTILREDAGICEGCLELSSVLTRLLMVMDPRETVYQKAVAGLMDNLQQDLVTMPMELRPAALLITDRFETEPD